MISKRNSVRVGICQESPKQPRSKLLRILNFVKMIGHLQHSRGPFVVRDIPGGLRQDHTLGQIRPSEVDGSARLTNIFSPNHA